MQCPNCRQLENGTWRRFPYHHIQDFFEEWTDDDEEDPLRFDPRVNIQRFHLTNLNSMFYLFGILISQFSLVGVFFVYVF